MNKKRLKNVCGLVAVLLLFSGCGKNGDDNTVVTDNPVNSIEQPEERELKIAVNTERDSFDPYLSAASDTEAMMLNVFEGLMGISETGEIIPILAKNWDISDDDLTYTFYLNEGVTFHDGVAFTADDVEFSYKRLSGLDGGQGASSKFDNVKEVTKIDDYTISIMLTEVDASFLSKCIVEVVPKDYNDQATKPIGTGPYKFSSFMPGQSTKLTINDHYYNEERKGSIKDVEFVLMADDNAKIMALRANSIDMFEAAREITEQVSDDYNKFHAYSNTIQLLALNNNVEPLDNINVRKALNYAIDRQEIVDIITNGNGYAIYTTFSPATSSWYNKETENVYTYNMEKAKELLKEAGYENGFEMEITVPSNYQIHVNTAQIIVNQLEKVGIKAGITQIEWAQWLEEVNKNANYQTSIVGLTGKSDPNDVAIRFDSDYVANFFNYSNPEYDELVERGIRESDTKVRQEIYNKAQQLLTDEAAAVFLQDPGRDVVSQADVLGYAAYPITFWDLSALYFK